MRLIGYLRVSTDDKGQDPRRQKEPIQARATKEGHEIVGWVEDNDGNHKSSGGIPAMERARFKEAIALAKKERAQAIVVENVDRLTRCGWKDVGATLYLLETDHELGLLFADVSGDDLLVDILVPLMAYVAKLGRKRLQETTRSGMRNARRRNHDPERCEFCKDGFWCPLARQGRPPKPDLTDDDWAVYDDLVENRGWGLRRVAVALTERRLLAAGRDGSPVVDPKARRKWTVSEPWLRDMAAKRVGNQRLSTRVVRPCHPSPRPKGPLSTHGETEDTEAEAAT